MGDNVYRIFLRITITLGILNPPTPPHRRSVRIAFSPFTPHCPPSVSVTFHKATLSVRDDTLVVIVAAVTAGISPSSPSAFSFEYGIMSNDADAHAGPPMPLAPDSSPVASVAPAAPVATRDMTDRFEEVAKLP